MPQRKTRQRYDTRGDAHFLTFSCFRRLPLLNRDRTRLWLVEAIDLGRQTAPFDLWAFVIMPEQAHLVIRPHEDVRISMMLKTIKQSVARKAIRWLHQSAPDFLTKLERVSQDGTRRCRFWQRGGGYDRNLRSVRDVHEKIQYVNDNPVRRGLVKNVEDWAWSSASAWLQQTDQPLRMDRDTLPPLTNTDDDITSRLMR